MKSIQKVHLIMLFSQVRVESGPRAIFPSATFCPADVAFRFET